MSLDQTRTYRLAVIPGDGIGKETTPEGVRVLEAAAKKFGFDLQLDHFDFSSYDYYAKHGTMMPEDWKEQIGCHDAIFFGAVGWPEKIPDHVSLWGSLLQFRREFDQYVNLRPVRLMPGVPAPLANRKPGDIDFWVVRENTEGEYSSIGGTHVSRHRARGRHPGNRDDPHRRRPRPEIRLRARQKRAKEAPHLGDEVERHLDHHALLGRARGGDGQALSRTCAGTSTTSTSSPRISCCIPDWFDVVVASNLFGDILSDLGPACTGTIGIAPSGNINPERNFPSLFEPVHGSAPDIAGQGIANPIGQIWSGAMMLEHLGETRSRRSDRQGHRARPGRADPAHPRPRRQRRHRACGKAVADALG